MRGMLLALVLVAVVAGTAPPAARRKASVVHMVFDDFRPDLPMYGQQFVAADNLEKFANRSLVFDRAYCQIAVCSPSRNSFMTGRRPNSTLVWNFFSHFREAQCPDTKVGTFATGTVIRSWAQADGQQSGGAGGCCTSCVGQAGCVAWTYKGEPGQLGGNCTLLSEISGHHTCAPGQVDGHQHVLPCLSGGRGAFPKFTSLPQHFKDNNFLTLGVGKLFHDGGYGFGGAPGDSDHPAGPGTPPLADPLSWSNETIQYPECEWTAPPDCDECEDAPQWSVLCPGLPRFVNSYPPNEIQGGGAAYLTPAGQGTCQRVPVGPFGSPHHGAGCTEAVPLSGDGAGADGSIDGRPPMLDLPVFKNAKVKLQFAAAHWATTGQPFFLNVGIKRPHLVWRVPEGIVRDHYNPETFTPNMPQNRVLDASVHPIAWVPFFGSSNPWVPQDVDTTVELRRFYYAAITWADYCAGQVLDEIERLDLQDKTVVVIHADHGWHLGEYNMWEKRTVWELGTRVPFMVHVPWLPQSHGRHTAGLTELVDVYPTLVDLLGLPLPTADSFPLEGLSLRPLLEQPSLRVLPGRDFALSTYARCPRVGEKAPLPNGPRTVWNTECIHDTERSSFPYMGYTIRVDNYRYTEFVRWNGSSLSPIWGEVLSRELYNHTLDVPGSPEWEERDDFEDINYVPSAPQELVSQLAEKLRAAFGVGGRPAFE